MSGEPAAARVRALLGTPEYARLFAGARAALEARGEKARSVALDGLDERERRALAGLLGEERQPDGPISLDLARLDRALRESAAGAGLREVLHALGGPLRDEREERRGRRERIDAMWRAAREGMDAQGRDELQGWLDGLRRSGLLLRAAKLSERAPEGLLGDALRAALALPASGELLAVFAARTLGDPHALDAGTPLGGLVLRAAATLTREPGGAPAPSPASSEARRLLWRAVGIDCDALSSDVLVLGLRPLGDGLTARQLRECAGAGEPRRLTLRELSRAPLALAPGSVVHVCENPAVVEAAADALGHRCAPLVCLEGVPSVAALALLRGAAASGARVRVHADHDWSGLRIVAQVLALLGAAAEPWRMSAGEHLAALAAAPHGPALDGRRAPAPWDPDLVPAMLAGGRAVLEEQVLDRLLCVLDAGDRAARATFGEAPPAGSRGAATPDEYPDMWPDSSAGHTDKR